MRRLTCELLEREVDITICGTASSAEDAREWLRTNAADLALVDVSLPKMNGIDFVREVAPSSDVPFLLFSGHEEPSYAIRGLTAGARGYVVKGSPAELADAIRRVIAGAVYVSEPLRALTRIGASNNSQ